MANLKENISFDEIMGLIKAHNLFFEHDIMSLANISRAEYEITFSSGSAERIAILEALERNKVYIKIQIRKRLYYGELREADEKLYDLLATPLELAALHNPTLLDVLMRKDKFNTLINGIDDDEFS